MLVLCVGLALAATAIGGCGGGAKTPQSAFFEFLRFVPDRPEYRQYLTYGDAAVWHASWGIPRIDNVEQLEGLDREPRAYWLYILPRQTTPPDYLSQYLLAEDQRSFYGFDLFNLDRYLVAGLPPDWITVAGFGFDAKQIAGALTGSGYQAEGLEPGGTLYRIRDDYEMDPNSPTKTGQMGNLNRIALLDGEMAIGKATAPVTASLAAYNDQIPSLADDPDYTALARALDDRALAGTGQLMGAIVMDDLEISLRDSVLESLGSKADAQQVEDKLAELGQGPQLPAYSLVAFVTSHTEGATYLILAVVFAKGTDGQAAADLLADRLQNHVSAAYKSPLSEVWAERRAKLEKTIAVEAGGLPVALVLVRADDPPPTPADQVMANAAVPSWIDLVNRRDLGFLAR
jgi:hypothetical protein